MIVSSCVSVFFFKQKTAYEMRISDWSSDVCSSDLHGGEIVAEGTLKQVLANKKSLTAAYLTGAKKIDVPKRRRPGNGFDLVLKGARANNLQNVTATIPLGTFTCVTGLSGSGKSSLVIDTLYRSEEHTSELQSLMRTSYA